MTLMTAIVKAAERGFSASAWPTISMDEWADMFGFGNLMARVNTTLNQPEETIGGDFAGLVLGAYRSNPIVFGLELKRLALFQQVVFQFQAKQGDKTLFGTPALAPLEEPEVGESTQDLAYRILLSADFGGDAFVVRRQRGSRVRLVVPRPDWVTIIFGSPEENAVEPNPLDMEMLAIVYQEGGPFSSNPPVIVDRSEFAHYAPVRDPLGKYRGIPWPIAALTEIRADKAAAQHKLMFFNNGATGNMIVSLDPSLTLEKARDWIKLFEQDHKGILNAYKTIYFGGGANATVVGKDFQQMDFKVVQGAGQTVMATAAGIHPVIAGLSEGLQGSSLNAGNFHEAKQLTGDTFLRPEWGRLAKSLEVIVKPPAGARLWYDEGQVPFLKDDIKDAAEVVNLKATAIRTLTDGGYKPATVVSSVTSGNLSGLVHSGYLTVQMQPLQADAAAGSDPTKPAGFFPIPEPTALLGTGYEFEVRCSGTRKDGQPCGQLLGKRTGPEPVGFERKCDRCGTLVAA